MTISEVQLEGVAEAAFIRQVLGCSVHSLTLVETISYGSLAQADRIYRAKTGKGSYWLVWDVSFGHGVYADDGFRSAMDIYTEHVRLAAERMRENRRTLSSVDEERVAPSVDGSRRIMKMQNNKPYKTIRSGLVRAVIWKNAPKNGNNRDFYSIQVERLFKRNEQSQWEQTNSFGVNDLARVKLVVSEAFKLLTLAGSDKPVNGEGAEPVVEEVVAE